MAFKIIMKKNLDLLRIEINQIDSQILQLLKQRFNVTNDVAKFKLENNMEIFQPQREKEVINARCEIARKLNLDEGFVIDLFQDIMDESKKLQKELIKNARP